MFRWGADDDGRSPRSITAGLVRRQVTQGPAVAAGSLASFLALAVRPALPPVLWRRSMTSKQLAIGIAAIPVLVFLGCVISFLALAAVPSGVRHLEQLGFHVHAKGDRGLRGTYIDAECRNPNLSDQDIPEVVAAMRSVPSVKYLELSGTRITDAGVQALTELSQLWSLDLSNTNVSDAGVRILSEGNGLVLSLDLSDTKVTADVLTILADGQIRIDSLNLRCTEITADEIQAREEAIVRLVAKSPKRSFHIELCNEQMSAEEAERWIAKYTVVDISYADAKKPTVVMSRHACDCNRVGPAVPDNSP